jgi:hypothetical protein
MLHSRESDARSLKLPNGQLRLEPIWSVQNWCCSEADASSMRVIVSFERARKLSVCVSAKVSGACAPLSKRRHA